MSADDIAASGFFLVKTNGGEWHDSDLHLWRGHQVRHAMRPECIRGRPVLIAEVVNPLLSESERRVGQKD